MSRPHSSHSGSRLARRGITATAALLLAAMLGGSLAGCAWLIPSPKSSYVDERGETITVDWRNFPGVGGTEGRAILDGPTIEETEERSEAVLAAVRVAISEQLGKQLGSAKWDTDRSDVNGLTTWSPKVDNGYGGRSMLQIYNSPVWELEIRVPVEEWDAVFESAGTAASGIGLTDRFEYLPQDPSEERLARWVRDVSFSHGSEFLSVAISDASLDAEALRDAKKFGHAIASVTLMYGASALDESDRAEFARRAAPFEGLEHPNLTD